MILPFLCLFFLSCTDKKEGKDFFNTENKEVDCKLYNADILMKYCDVMTVKNSLIFFSWAGPHRETVVVQESDGKEVGSIGREGGGPGEFVNPVFAGHSAKKDTVYIYDYGYRKIISYAVSIQDNEFKSKLAYEISTQDFKFYENMKRLKNGYYVGLPFEAKATDSILVLLDVQQNVIKRFGKSPIELKTDYSDFKKCFSNTRMAVYENKIFIAVARFGYIAGYEISDNGKIKTLFEKMLVSPSYRSNDGYIVFDKENNREGFYDIAASSTYIFTTYGGKTLKSLLPGGGGMEPETFAILDHKGNLVSRVKMNHKGARLCVSEDEKMLYHCALNPEYDIAAYRIKDMVK